MSEIYSLSWESCLAYVAFIEGNFPQCGTQYIAVIGGKIPLLVRIMWALPMHYPGHFPHCTQEIIMDFFFIENSIINCLPIPLLFAEPISLYFCQPYLYSLIRLLAYPNPLYLICLFKNNNGFSIETPLLYPGYIVGNDLGNAWEVPTLFGLEVGFSTKDSYILWVALWKASLNKRNICQT